MHFRLLDKSKIIVRDSVIRIFLATISLVRIYKQQKHYSNDEEVDKVEVFIVSSKDLI